jgi:DNA-binding LacI/PurR family transcriptional regulator
MKMRVQGCKNALLKRGIAHQAMVKELDYRDKNKQASIKNWLLEHQDIEAVLCLNDDVCYPTIGAIEEIGLTIPHDIEVASFEEPRWFKYLTPPITALRQPAEEIGRIAISLLLKRIQAPPDAEFQDIFLATTFIQNRSGTLYPISRG